MEWRPVVLEISGEMELGFCGGFRMNGGDSGLVLDVEGWRWMLGFWVSLGKENGGDLEV